MGQGSPSSGGVGGGLDAAFVRELATALSFRGDDDGVPCSSESRALAVHRCLEGLGPRALRRVGLALLALTLPQDGRRVNQKCFRFPREGARMERFRFELADRFDRAAAAAACALDNRITQVRPSLVPSAMSEEEYFGNYFSHVAAVREWALQGAAHVEAHAPPRLLLGKQRGRGDFSVGEQSFRTLSPPLLQCRFPSRQALAAFLARGHGRPGAPGTSSRTSNSSTANSESSSLPEGWSSATAEGAGAGRKALLMDLMRGGGQSLGEAEASTVLGALLELSVAEDLVLTSAFWQRAERRVLRLSCQTEAFTGADLLEAPEPRLAALFESVNALRYDAKRERDRKAVAAAWELDPRLSAAFQGFIPRLLSKEEFWTHYLRNAMRCIVDEYVALSAAPVVE